MSWTEVSADAQGMGTLYKALCEIERMGPLLSGRECAVKAAAAIKESIRIRMEANPIPIQDVTGFEHGDRTGQPRDVLYTLAVTENGDAKTWTSDRVQTAEQIAFVQEAVLNCAGALTNKAAGPAGLN